MASENKGEVLSVDLEHNCVTTCSGEVLPITNILGKAVVAGPTLAGQWVMAMMADDECEGMAAWREYYAERVN